MQGTINYTIEQGFILEAERRKGLTELYPWDKMKVNDSFLLGSFNEGLRASCLRKATYYAKTENPKPKITKKFSSKMTDQGFRIWRIK